MRRQIYGGSAAHAEVALTLGKLGEADRMRGDLRGAASHFAAQREMFEILALREIGISAPPPPQPPPPQPAALVPATVAASAAASAPVPPLQRILRSVTATGGDGAPPPPPPKLLNQLLSAVRWQVLYHVAPPPAWSCAYLVVCLLWHMLTLAPPLLAAYRSLTLTLTLTLALTLTLTLTLTLARSVLQRARRWRLVGGAVRRAARKRSSPVG